MITIGLHNEAVKYQYIEEIVFPQKLVAFYSKDLRIYKKNTFGAFKEQKNQFWFLDLFPSVSLEAAEGEVRGAVIQAQ